MPLPALLPIAGSILGNIFGGIFSGGDRDAAESLFQQSYDEINKLGLPPDLSKPIIYEKFKQAGLLTPEAEQAIDVGISKVSQIQSNPELAKVQMGALEELKSRGKVGLGAEDRLAIAKIRQSAARNAEAKRQQILQQMQARGIAGSGAELATQLAASQAAAEQEGMEGLEVASQASQRALQALQGSGALAGQIRGQEFGEEQAKAAAADELNRFNISNQVSQQSRNVGARNAAQQFNLQGQQTASDRNVAQGNQELNRQKEAQRQYYQDKFTQARAKAQSLQEQASQKAGEAGRKQQAFSQIGSAMGAGAGQLFGRQQAPTSNILTQEEIEKNLREGHGV